VWVSGHPLDFSHATARPDRYELAGLRGKRLTLCGGWERVPAPGQNRLTAMDVGGFTRRTSAACSGVESGSSLLTPTPITAGVGV